MSRGLGDVYKRQPTVGAMEGCFATLALASNLFEDRRTVLFLEPGFPVNKLQTRLLGLERASLDLYDYRGEALVEAIERRVAEGDVCAIIWSSPNNPAWVVLDEDELAGIGRVCDRHSVLAIEDLAYFGMDVRRDYTRPGEPPYQPTVLRYTRRGVCIVSSSKMFSYAGQRIAVGGSGRGAAQCDGQATGWSRRNARSRSSSAST